MNTDLNKLRQISGIFLEATFLVFIVVYSWADVHKDDGQSTNALSLHVAGEIVLREAPTSSFLVGAFAQTHSFHCSLAEQVVDLPAVKVSLSKALLQINTFSRNSFYTFLSTNAP